MKKLFVKMKSYNSIGVFMEKFSLRKNVLQFAKEFYHTKPEHLWEKHPNYEVLRNSNSKKWFAIIMDVPKNKIGLEGEDIIDILNLKADPVMAGTFMNSSGILPGYHMNKAHWITVLLDGTVPIDVVELLISSSYELTKKEKVRDVFFSKL